MILLSNTTDQTLSPGQSIVFDKVLLHTGCGESHRPNSTSVKLKCNGIYEIHFSGNIGASSADTSESTDTASASTDTSEISMMVMLSETPLAETKMDVSGGESGTYNNVSTATLVKNLPCEYDRITVSNSGTEPVCVSSNASLFVKRLS